VQYNKKKVEKYYAMKVCSTTKVANLRKETDILMEKHALAKLRDRYREASPCVKLIGTFKDGGSLCFLMDLLPGKAELWLKCRSFGLLSDASARNTFREICKSVKKVHDAKVIHRDLKPENMFQMADGSVKLIDFGSAEDLEKPEVRLTHIDDNPKKKQHLNFVGTPQYMAPECVRNQGSYLASDIWSLGAILHQLYLGVLPFRGGSDYLVFKRSVECDFNIPLSAYADSLLPADAKALILNMIQLDPTKRPTIDDILTDPFFSASPDFNHLDSALRTLADDFITRGNVHKLAGETALLSLIDETLTPHEDVPRIRHFKALAMQFVFDRDPDEAYCAAEKKEAAVEEAERSSEEDE
jgi:serine/threonine protein kinase